MKSNMIEIKPISGAIGAEIYGIDLSEPISNENYLQLRNLWVKHQVIFFRDQNIGPQHHKALASLFGPVLNHPAYETVKGFPEVTILESTPENPTKIELWHTDMTFKKSPPLGSIVRGIVIPEKGGDTMWSSLTAAYQGLSDKMQQFLSGLNAVHDFAHGFKESLAEPGGRERLSQALKDNPPVEHPVVRTHPESGERLIFVNELFTTHIVGMKTKESDSLLKFLYKHCITPEYTCRFQWRSNSLAFWDNRATLHKPVNDYFPAHRRLERITIEGQL